MARIARRVVPDLPYHVTQRGNRCETIFFSGDDYQAYLDFLKVELDRAKSQVWAW